MFLDNAAQSVRLVYVFNPNYWITLTFKVTVDGEPTLFETYEMDVYYERGC